MSQFLASLAGRGRSDLGQPDGATAGGRASALAARAGEPRIEFSRSAEGGEP